jgi:hypothetical protein
MFSAGLPAASPIVCVELGEKVDNAGVLVPKIELKLAPKTELAAFGVISVSVSLEVVNRLPPRSVNGETAIPYPKCGSGELPAKMFPPT